MKGSITVGLAFVGLLVALPSTAQDPGTARPHLVVREIVQGMPRSERQEVRVLTATITPRQKTPHHTHRFPVTGTF